MTQKVFLTSVGKGEVDIIALFLTVIQAQAIDYCVIGGLAVNAYVEPVVSLDLDLVILARQIDALIAHLRPRFTIKTFEHSINLFHQGSDLRIQIQRDPQYQEFLRRATLKLVLGYEMMVAALEDVLTGKILAYHDFQRRASKRQKDLADILRMIEAYPALLAGIPEPLQQKIRRII